MNIFYVIFFLIVGYLLVSIFKKRDFLKFIFTLFEIRYEQNKKSLNDAVFVYEEEKEKGLSKEEIFSLGLGDLEHERLVAELEEIDIPKHLEKEWGLTFESSKSKEHTLYTLQQIWKEGTLSLLFSNIQLEKEVSVSDIVAFDSSRFTELLRQVRYLKFLEDEELWGLLFLNAQRVQDAYSNWDAFKDAYFRGLTLYHFVQLEEEAQNSFDFKKEVRLRRESSTVELVWLKEEIFSHFKREEQ